MNSELDLRDIHAAPVPPWWPPSIGWWLLALLVLWVLYVLAMRMLRIYRTKQQLKLLLAESDGLLAKFQANQQKTQYLRSVSELLRRVVIHTAGRSDLAGASGNQWASALIDLSGEQSLQPVAQSLAEQTYRPQPGECDPEQVNKLAKLCIEAAWRQSLA